MMCLNPGVMSFEPIRGTSDLRERVGEVFKRYNISDKRAENELVVIFSRHIDEAVIPALAEILTIMYNDDKEALCTDITAIKLLNSKRE